MADEPTLTCDSRDLLDRVGDRKTTREYQNKEEIYSQGDVANAMFYIESGHVTLTVVSKSGKKAILAILGKGDFFGEKCLLNNSRRATTATALQHCIIVCVRRAALKRVIRREHEYSSRLVFHLLSRIRRIQEDFTDHLLHPSERRLARLLLRLSQLGQRSRAEFAILRVSQETLAAMVGTTRSRVNFFMNRFRDMGLIKYDGKVYDGRFQVRRAMRAFLLHD